MRSDLHVYVGPFAIVNQSEDDYDQWLTNQISVVLSLVHVYEDGNVLILIPNVEYDGMDRDVKFHRLGGEYNECTPIDGTDVEIGCICFNRAFGDVLKELGEHTVDWGILTYYI